MTLRLSRRHLLLTAALAPLSTLPGLKISSAVAQDAPPWRHGVSLFGEVKYPAGFTKFDYVNADAPRGGVVRQISIGTFDSFNLVVAGVKGQVAPAVVYIYETLMTASQDEVSSEYGLLAESVQYPNDYSWATYRLRAEARWHDGKPVTPDDVIFSLEALKQLSPRYAGYYRHVVKTEKIGERDVKFTFDAPGNRELPQIVGQLMVMPKHWWQGADAEGRKRDIGATTLEKPLGSGPYRIKDFVAGRSVTLERVRDYWGAKLPARVGQNNFDEMRFEFFRDETVALEAFKADQADWFAERRAKSWATEYDFPAVKDKRVLLEEFPIRSSGRMQGFAFNLRRDLFRDARLRRAFNYAFDFEEMNKQLFYGQYGRINSYFEGTDLASSGKPEGRELEILETVRDKVPAEVFTTPYTNPVGGTPDNVRGNLREATRLLKEAGFEVKDRKLVDRAGKLVSVEFLQQNPSSERIALFYKPALERLGIGVVIRTVDNAQYENRVRNFDFDIITDLWSQSLSPGNEQRDFWSSTAADTPGSNNTVGIKNPAVDALIDKIIFAKDRETLVAATKALDRYAFARYARWDRFGRPDPLPKYGVSGFPALWWWDAAKAEKAGKRS